MSVVDLPRVGSRWIFPRWNNREYTGPWAVVTLGVYDEEGAGPCVALQRDAEPRLIHHEMIRFWPGGWEPAD